MKPLRVTEVFYSLQGEGARQGDPSVFVRLAGCNLACKFCDTEFESGKDMGLDELQQAIYAAVKRSAPESRALPGLGLDHRLWIVWTGGEPAGQLTAEWVEAMKQAGFRQAIETNGSLPVPPGLDHVCVSPKVAEHVVAKNFPDGVTELRYVRHAGQPGVPSPAVRAEYYFLSPMFHGNEPDPENLRHCVRLCLENPRWSLSVQSHKLWRVL